MTKAEQFYQSIRGKKVAFIGAGVSHRELLRQFAQAGAQVTLCDKKPTVADFGPLGETLAALGVHFSLGENYLAGLAGQDIIMRTPGFEYFTPALQAAKAAGAQVTSEMELFFELCPCKIYGITGSDGKTTSSSLIAEMHRAMGKTVWLGGNIGVALLPLIDRIAPEDVAVVELSSFQLISMHTSPDVAVITNITPNHLDHHKDMQEYIDAKRNILLYQSAASKTVLGYHNDITRSLAGDVKGQLYWFSRFEKVEKGAYLEDNGDLCFVENGTLTRVMNKDAVRLRGLHNVENLLDAIAACAGDVSFDKMAQVGERFAGVEHRIEPVRTLDGVQWFNDSIGTSPTRTIAGLRSFADKIILIAGGYDKHIPYQPLAPEILAHVKTLVLMGATGPVIEQCLKALPEFDGAALPILHAESMEDAVAKARAAAKPGDVVMLSPASASFDSYPNFEKRGEHFKAIVNALAQPAE